MNEITLFPKKAIAVGIIILIAIGFSANAFNTQHVSDAINNKGTQITEKVLDGSLGKDILR